MIERERYIISKNTNGITYHDTGEMTPVEREYMLKLIQDDLKLRQAQMEESQSKAKANKANMRRPMGVPNTNISKQ